MTGRNESRTHSRGSRPGFRTWIVYPLALACAATGLAGLVESARSATEVLAVGVEQISPAVTVTRSATGSVPTELWFSVYGPIADIGGGNYDKVDLPALTG